MRTRKQQMIRDATAVIQAGLGGPRYFTRELAKAVVQEIAEFLPNDDDEFWVELDQRPN